MSHFVLYNSFMPARLARAKKSAARKRRAKEEERKEDKKRALGECIRPLVQFTESPGNSIFPIANFASSFFSFRRSHGFFVFFPRRSFFFFALSALVPVRLAFRSVSFAMLRVSIDISSSSVHSAGEPMRRCRQNKNARVKSTHVRDIHETRRETNSTSPLCLSLFLPQTFLFRGSL